MTNPTLRQAQGDKSDPSTPLGVTIRNPIGLFDSGVGGLTVWKELNRLLPGENTVYLADNKNAPYGYKTVEDIVGFSIKNTEKLLELGAKVVVVACNTATTNAMGALRKRFNIPFVGIEPAVKPAAQQTKTGHIGILATEGTLSSPMFEETSDRFARNVNVIEIAGEGLAALIEDNRIDDPKTRRLLVKYTRPMIEAGIDQLAIGCTHYPFLIPQLRDLLPKNVCIIDSGVAVAKQVKAVLEKHGLLHTGKADTHAFYSNGRITTLKALLQPVQKTYHIETLDF